VSKIKISPDSNFAASINEQTPTLVWVWDLVKMQLNSLIVQKESVKDISWSPNTLNLNISSSDAKIFLWSLRGASVCMVPPMTQKPNFSVTKSIWNPNGKNFAAVETNSGLVFVYP
jgi:WD40 repeat protein